MTDVSGPLHFAGYRNGPKRIPFRLDYLLTIQGIFFKNEHSENRVIVAGTRRSNFSGILFPMMNHFTDEVKKRILCIPYGRVATYGQIATWAGNPRGARQVARILHACSRRDNLPWHRIVNRQGRISLPPGQGFEIQKALLVKEGVRFNANGTIDLDRFLWQPFMDGH